MSKGKIEYQILISYAVNHTKRIVAIVVAVILIIFFPFVKSGYYFFNSLVYDLFSSIKFLAHSGEKKDAVADLLIALTEHGIFGLIIYAAFTDVIERWLGHKIREVPRFNSSLFISKIAKSNEQVVIHETFIRELIVEYPLEFKNALEQFLKNCIQADPKNLHGKVKILILSPLCQEIKKRYAELEGIDIPLANFLIYTQQWLVDLQEMQKNINKIALQHINTSSEKNDFFELKVGYEKPSFSLYYCDKYASISYYDKKPSVRAPQIVFLDANKSEAAKKQLTVFEQYWYRAVSLEAEFEIIDDKNAILQFEEVVRVFKDITIEVNPTKIREKLEDLSKMCSTNHALVVELINHLESNHKKEQINYFNINKVMHFNIFGTGGDKADYRTINISTIASILASHFRDPNLYIDALSVIKSGTLAVTSKVGSQQFYQNLELMLINSPEEYRHVKKKNILDYNSENKSTYLPITYFGYIYREVVRRARSEMYLAPKSQIGTNRKIIDIYKIIFPCANLTGYKAIINGVSRTEYIEFFEYVYVRKRKTGIIIHNSKGIDELFEGTNHLIYYQKGRRICEYTLNIKTSKENSDLYKNYFRESEAKEHVKQFFKLFDQTDLSVNKEIRETIAYNVALFIQLYFLVKNPYSSSDNSHEDDLGPDRLSELMRVVYDYFFGKSSIMNS